MVTSAPSSRRPWQYGAGVPRLLLLSQPSPAVLAGMQTVIRRYGLEARLGRAMFDAVNWHQTWSGRYEDTAAMRDRLRRVGAGISVPAFTLSFNRVGGEAHWTLLGRGRPEGFKRLLGAVRAELQASDLDAPGHTPHVTISYRAPEPLKTLPIPPVAWQVDEIRLVAGQGRPYRYEVLDRWRLLQPPASPQLPLF